MKNKNKSFLGFFCFLTLSLTACEAKEPAASSPYPVYDSEAWADPFGSADLYWLDNHRVIFRSVHNNDKKLVTNGPFSLSIWEIGKRVKPYTEYHPSVTVCVRDGMIHRTQKDASGNVQRLYGKFGEEKPFEFPKTKGVFFDNMNCRPNENPVILAKRAQGRAIRPLLDRHGYLDIGSIRGPESSANNPVMFYQLDGTTIKHAARRLELNIFIGYFPLKNAYLFQGSLEKERASDIANLWPPGTRQIFTWLHPDGRIEPLIIPADPWPDKKVPNFGFIGAILPVKNGFVFPHGKAKGPKDAGNSGLHLLRDGKIEKLIGGYYSSTAVSPDGCRVAFVHYPYADATIVHDPAPIRLKAVDLCPNKEENHHGQ